MQTELLSISRIFTESLFRIPDYQRGYAWTEKQLKDFWNDINQLEDGKHHYTGVLTLEVVPTTIYQRWDDDIWIIKAKHYIPYYVVDGQQRLTTVIILIQSIIEKVNGEQMLNYSSKEEIRKKFIFESKDGGISRSYLFGYEKDNPSYEFLKTDIFLEKSDNHSTSEQTIYTHNLLFAKKFFSEKIAALGIEALEKIYARVTQHLMFNIYTITDDVDVFVAFETMNNRGKPLSHLELLKNRLIFLSTKFNVEQSEKTKLRGAINEAWKSAYHYIGKNENCALDDDEFLKVHFFVYFGSQLPKRSGNQDTDRILWSYEHEDYYKDYLLEDVFTSQRLPTVTNQFTSILPSLSIKSLYDYAQSVKNSVENYYRLFNPSEASISNEEKIFLERLRRLGITTNLAVLLLALYQVRSDTNNRAEILVLLEKIQFLRSISPYIEGLDRIEYMKLGVDLSSGNQSVKQIIDKLTIHLNQMVKKINFSTVFAIATKHKSYYGWRGIKYFMFEYEQNLLEKSRTNRNKLIWDEFIKEDFETDYRTVEHIYPQKVVDDCWKSLFNVYEVSRRNILKNSIGNLIPLSKSKNSSLQNKCFTEKKGNSSNKAGYAYGCYSEIEVSQLKDWTPNEILSRGLRLLEFMEQRWGLSLGNESQKIKALGLEFVKKD